MAFWIASKLFFAAVWNRIAFLFVPPILYVTLAVAAVGGGYLYHSHAVEKAYEQGYNKGVADEKAAVKKQREAEQARDARIAYEQKEQQRLIVESLETRLDAAEKKKAQVQIVTKEVVRYVTPQADAAAPIPAGFVYLHNLSTATDPYAMAGSKPKDVDATTAVTLSEIAAVDAENNAECQLRGEVIASWIEWYNRNKQEWENAVKAHQQSIPVQ